MEIEGLKLVSHEEMPEELRKDIKILNEIFDRGVQAAKEENERLGLTPSEEYPTDETPAQKVAESEE